MKKISRGICSECGIKHPVTDTSRKGILVEWHRTPQSEICRGSFKPPVNNSTNSQSSSTTKNLNLSFKF